MKHSVVVSAINKMFITFAGRLQLELNIWLGRGMFVSDAWWQSAGFINTETTA